MKKGEALQRCRLDRGLSQSQLAKMAGISVRVLQSYEQGQRDINKAEAATVLALADALQYHPAEIMNDYPDPEDPQDLAAEEIIENGLYDAAVEAMDDDIRERLHDTMAPCTELEFLKAYMKEHKKKFRQPFTIM